ncbi:hypothetical protein DIJ64_06820 [Mycobacterium leprae]|uniref:Uncharacterized protein n=2 Tax=Mycobacterium leprae TaxID=1769 RepID=A0AAD0KTT0_MYCLR|nr:hypothetical protein [Mycobacterium leprae]AWV47883.1 hypothetical protein DIJ64_06820 [Mycobacterium leprae]OAR20753.1 hypothetical protein A8144_09425 [Mycobacterium leprae 3125609]OAX70905.1 hypothetical protein A3216_08990 [Mycobacterium leprae 7935681]
MPLMAGLDCRPGLRRLYVGSGARAVQPTAMLNSDVRTPLLYLAAIALLSHSMLDGWRAVGPLAAELASTERVDRCVLAVTRLLIGLL